MSMRTLTILQFTGSLTAYFFVVVLLPAFVLHEKIKERDLVQRFFICFLSGNFYVMNLVFLFQLLHISNTVTLTLGTAAPVCYIWYLQVRYRLKSVFEELWRDLQKIAQGYLGIRTMALRILVNIRKSLWKGIRILAVAFGRRWIQGLLTIAIVGALVWFYGLQTFYMYGYTASDTPVHISWISGMNQNNIFLDGVYPFGYHCILYYIHTVFHIDVYVLMRVFPFVQTLMIHMVLLGFIRLCCRSKYVAYAAVGIYALGNFLHFGTYFRYFAVLPQEYGMMFILPAIYFAFLFFKTRREEINKRKPVSESTVCLVYFCMSFSMTLAVHFYDTMIAGMFCVGIAIGYLKWFSKKDYFVRVAAAGIVSVMIAILPMAVAFITGTPLQGSLGWGMSVINGTVEDEEEKELEEEIEEGDENTTVYYYDSEGNLIAQEGGGGAKKANKKKADKAPKGIGEKIAGVGRSICDGVKEYVLREEQEPWHYLVIFAGVGALFLLGFVFFLCKRRCYGAMLLSTAVFMAFLLVLQAADRLGLPELMDQERCRIYLSYMLPVVFAFVADGILYFVIWPDSWDKLRNFVSLACVVGAVALLWNGDFRKQRSDADDAALVTNEAITCLTNIIRDETDYTWTICSVNDERHLGRDHGYHYELISFLEEMEFSKMEDQEEDPFIKIPTNSVYFFVEKVPIDYTEEYEGSGQSISEQGAARELPDVGGIEMYKGENRWILMSRIYYWAQAFTRLYPNEMKVYFETDNFICYKIEQNPYRLYNFAIDYGYNSRKAGG